jgi:hypothetical protein
VRFSRIEKRMMLGVFDAILPSGADPRLPIGARDLPMGRFLDDILQRSPVLFALGLRAALWLVTLSPLAVIGRPRTFGGLSPGDRVRVLERLSHSRVYAIRELPNLLKLVACLGFAGHPDVRRHIGLPAGEPPAWAAEAEE